MAHVDTSSCALKKNLANLKTEVDKLDIHKLASVPIHLTKLSDVVKNDVVKKPGYDKLVAKLDNIDTSDFLLLIKYNTDKTELENKIPDVIDFIKKTKLTELQNKIPEISNLATKTALTTVENKILDVSNLTTKTALTALENKIPDVTKLATKTPLTTVDNKIPDVSSLVKKTYYNTRVAEIDTKLSSLNRKITPNKTKHLLVENELSKLKTFDSSYFIGKSHFEGDGTQNYLVFQPINKYFKLNTNALYILSWQPRGLSTETIDPPTTSLSPLIDYVGNKIRLKFTGSCLKQSNKISYTHKTIVNIYIFYELGASSSHNNDTILKIVYLVQLL